MWACPTVWNADVGRDTVRGKYRQCIWNLLYIHSIITDQQYRFIARKHHIIAKHFAIANAVGGGCHLIINKFYKITAGCHGGNRTRFIYHLPDKKYVVILQI